VDKHRLAFEWLADIEWSEDESENDEHDLDFIPPPSASQRSVASSTVSGTNTIRKQQREALMTFLQLGCPNRPLKSIKTTNSFKDLRPASKSNFLSSTRIIVNMVLEYLVGNDAAEVRKELFAVEEGNCFKLIF